MARLIKIGSSTINATMMPIHMMPSVEPATEASAADGVGVIACARLPLEGSQPCRAPDLKQMSQETTAARGQ